MRFESIPKRRRYSRAPGRPNPFDIPLWLFVILDNRKRQRQVTLLGPVLSSEPCNLRLHAEPNLLSNCWTLNPWKGKSGFWSETQTGSVLTICSSNTDTNVYKAIRRCLRFVRDVLGLRRHIKPAEEIV